jgi:hypothetical protein
MTRKQETEAAAYNFAFRSDRYSSDSADFTFRSIHIHTMRGMIPCRVMKHALTQGGIIMGVDVGTQRTGVVIYKIIPQPQPRSYRYEME